MSYKPDYNDPRVIKRIRKAVGYTSGMLPDGIERPLANSQINKYIGRQSYRLGSFLSHKILICTDPHYSKIEKQCKKYVLNQIGVDYLLYCLDNPNNHLSYKAWQLQYEDETFEFSQNVPTNPKNSIFDKRIVGQFIEEEYADQFLKGEFSYSDKSHRLWNPLQNYRRDIKEQIFVYYGYYHNYDIDACAPTLILQYARELGFTKLTPYIDDYLTNKNTIRKMLADESELDIKQIKVLINALWCGARMGTTPMFALSMVISDKASMLFLKQHDFIIGLRKEIKALWKHIHEELGNIEYITDSLGRIRHKSMSSTNKWQIYFQLERKVADKIDEYLRLVDIKIFREHDGFVSDEEIDMDNCIAYVKAMTGFDIKLSYKMLEPDMEPKTLDAFRSDSNNFSVFADAHTSKLFSQSLTLSFSTKTNDNDYLAVQLSHGIHTLVCQKSIDSLNDYKPLIEKWYKDNHYVRKKQLYTS